MKPVDQPYEAHQICDTCEEEGECFHGKSVWLKWEECLKIYKEDGRAGEVQVINKYLNKNVPSNLAIKPGQTYSIKISQKKKERKTCLILFWRKFPFG